MQRLVETGRITPEEAAVHPRRSVLMRVLGDIDQSPEIDTSILGTVPGDRWMLCSDGLTSYVPQERILAVLANGPTPADAANALVEEALEHGAPDNVTAIVLRHRPSAVAGPSPAQLVGSAASALDPELAASGRAHNRLPALLLHPIRTTRRPRPASSRSPRTTSTR